MVSISLAIATPDWATSRQSSPIDGVLLPPLITVVFVIAVAVLAILPSFTTLEPFMLLA